MIIYLWITFPEYLSSFVVVDGTLCCWFGGWNYSDSYAVCCILGDGTVLIVMLCVAFVFLF